MTTVLGTEPAMVPPAMVPGRVSIVIPCYKGEAYLAEAIGSCLALNYPDIEVIVVSDASPDRCAEIARWFAAEDARVNVVEHLTNQGVSAAFNTGYRLATGEFFTRLAQDDMFEPDGVTLLVSEIKAHPECGLAYGSYQWMNDVGERQEVRSVAPESQALVFGNRIGLAVLWRRSVHEAVGPFRAEYDTSEDYEYWLRIGARFQIIRAAGVLMCVRRHAEMGTKTRARQQARTTVAAVRDSFRDRQTGLTGWLRRRQALAFAHLHAALCLHDCRGDAEALGFLLKSFGYWPAPLPPAGCKVFAWRPRMALAIARNWLTSVKR